ncbi:MAG: translation initiation factor IF-2 [Holosporales bacterium]|jgi:translation initiation factor IF-2|nr:translation initiation factor IF-2 [Holosporales bacterium]
MGAETTKKTLVLNRKIKTVGEVDHIQQSFTRGRVKTVAVEVKKRRGIKKLDNDSSLSNFRFQTEAFSAQDETHGGQLNLTARELEARVQAVKEAKEREGVSALKERIDNINSPDSSNFDDVTPKGEAQDASSSKKRDEGFPALRDEEKYAGIKPKPVDGENSPDGDKDTWKKPVKKSIREVTNFGGRRQKKLSVHDALIEEQERIRSLAAVRRARNKARMVNVTSGDDAKKIVREVVVPEAIEVRELANRMAIRAGELIKTLIKLGVTATANQTIDGDTAELVVSELGHKVKRFSDSDIEEDLQGREDEAGQMAPRAPVVTVMGHVDHGKTSLLDAFRRTDVAAKEAGGITQHIGAYQVKMTDERKITFIDTPGHEAFAEMRVRGANITDVVVLVIAADDSVKEQSLEAINHARAAKAPIIVAINKIDKPGADPNKVRQDLLRHEVIAESLGGDVVTVEVSAKTGKGLDELSEAILLQAEILDLKANPNRNGDGVVIESRQEKGLGPVATVLVKRGTLKRGDIFVSDRFSGRIRAMKDYLGNKVESALPSMPIEVTGFDGVPSPGSDFIVLDDEAKAREVAQYRDKKGRAAACAVTVNNESVEQMFDNLTVKDGVKELPLIIRADMQGSIEAIDFSLQKLSTSEVAVKILHSGVGEITESDVSLAGASAAAIVGFNVRANAEARELARRNAVSIKYYSIIYDLIDEITASLSGLLAPELREKALGTAEVRQVFGVKKVGKIAGCMVVSGSIKRGAKVRVLRDNVVIHKGGLSSLMRIKDEVKEVREGFECGVGIESYQDIQEGDSIECFMIEEIERKLK